MKKKIINKKEWNKKLKQWALKLKCKKQRAQCCTLPVRRERKKGENQTAIDDNLITVSCHMPLHMEEDTVTHLPSFGYQVVSHVPSKWCGCHSLTSVYSVFLIKKIENNMKKPKCHHDLNNYTKYSYESIKIPSNTKFIFAFFKVKVILSLYMDT